MRAVARAILPLLAIAVIALPAAGQAGYIEAWAETTIGDSTASIRSNLTMMYMSVFECQVSNCVRQD